VGTARCYGTVADAEQGRYWLFLEKVAGIELWQCELETWLRVAGWLAGLHERCRDARAGHLRRYDRDAYLVWLHRAQEFVGRPELERIVAGYGSAVDRLLALPVGFIHGEFTASNVLVQETSNGLRVCPIDWEMAAVGPALLDLAALTAGGWNDDERDAIASAYYEALPVHARSPRQEFSHALDCARLYVALQWLGWAPAWSPPPEHAHDWLAEVSASAERLGV
jgi:aminoglycoside phosphotransferase (APT) family kinase protein